IPFVRHLMQSFRVWRSLAGVHRASAIDVVEFSNWNATNAIHSVWKIAPQITRLSTSICQIEPSCETSLARITERWAMNLIAVLERFGVRRSDGIITQSRA